MRLPSALIIVEGGIREKEEKSTNSKRMVA